MKLKFFSVILSIATITVLTAPIAANAQSNRQQFRQRYQDALSNLNLTSEQQAQLQQIGRETRSQMQTILTPAQRETFQSAIASGKSVQQAVRSIDFSPSQRSKVRSIMQSHRQKVQNILTEEQRQQLRQQMRSRRGRRW